MIITTISALPFSAHATVYSGKCGDNVSYSFDTDTGDITISGTGDMYNYSTSEAPWANYADGIKTVIVEYGVTSIGDYAFNNPPVDENRYSKLESVKIAQTVTKIGQLAFRGCNGLTTVVIPYGVKTIKYAAFYDCANLKKIALPSTLTSIASTVFGKCTSIFQVYYAGFESDWNAIDINSDNKPLLECQNRYYTTGFCGTDIENIEFSLDPETGILYMLGYNGNDVMEDFIGGVKAPWNDYMSQIKGVVIKHSITHVGMNAFNGANIKDVMIYDSVRTIGHGAFHNNPIEHVDYLIDTSSGSRPGTDEEWNTLVSIGEMNDELLAAKPQISTTGWCGEYVRYSFDSNRGILRIYGSGEMFDYFDSYERSPFFAREDIKKVVVEGGVTTIGSEAFFNCVNMTEVDLPSSVTLIEDTAFSGCTGITTVTYGEDELGQGGPVAPDWNAVMIGVENDYLTKAKPQEVTLSGKCGDNVEYSLNATSGVLTITGSGEMYDYNESGQNTVPWERYNTFNVKRVFIQATITKIGTNTFDNCNNLSTVKFYGTQADWDAIEIGEGNDSLLAVKPQTIPSEDKCGDNVYYSLNPTTGELRIWGSGPMYDYDIDDNKSPFLYNNDIESIVIEDGVTYIGEYAFDTLPNLDNVTIPNSVTKIGEWAFFYCYWLKTLNIGTGLTTISDYAFSGCARLETVNYAGTRAELDAITVGIDNEAFLEAICEHTPGAPVKENEKRATLTSPGYYTSVTYCTKCGKMLSSKRVMTSKLVRRANTLKAKGKTKSINYNKKKDIAIKRADVMTVSKPQGKVTYAKASGNARIYVNSKTGALKVRRGTKKGTYKVKIKVTAAGAELVKAKTVTVTVTIKVK